MIDLRPRDQNVSDRDKDQLLGDRDRDKKSGLETLTSLHTALCCHDSHYVVHTSELLCQ